MRILIVGGTSSLARALKPALSEFAEVITAGRTGCDIFLDLGNLSASIELPRDIDVVVNTAAHFGGVGFEEMLQAEGVNVLGTLKLCKLCSNAQIKQLVLISSIFSDLDRRSSFYDIYSLSKRHSDEIAELYGSIFGLPLTILKPSQFYGVGDAYRRHHPFLFRIIDQAEKNEDICIYGGNDARRNFIHVEDVVRIIALVIQRGIVGIFACAYTRNVSYSEVAAAAIRAFDSKSGIKFDKEQPDIPDNIFEADDSLYRLIDYYPQISISLGMMKEAEYRMGTK